MNLISKVPFFIFFDLILVEYVEIEDIVRLKVAFTNKFLQSWMQVCKIISKQINVFCFVYVFLLINTLELL